MTVAAVVGSGPNGLTAAIRLAQAGLDVTVVEASDRPGGGTLTSESTVPGLLHDDCSAFHPTGVASPFFTSLDLQRHGLNWLWPEVDLAHPLDDGRAGLAGRDASLTADSLGVDAQSWTRMFRASVSNFDDLVQDVFGPVVHVPQHPVTFVRFGVRTLPPAKLTVRRFRDEPAKALFMGVAAHAFGRLDLPLSSSVGMLLTASAHAVGWPVAEGGSEAIARALVAELTELGGRVITGVPVTSMDQLRDVVGARPEVTVFDTAPNGAADIAGDALPPRVLRGLRSFKRGPGSFKVDFAIEGDIPWRNADCRRAGTVHVGGSAAQIADVEGKTARGEMPDQPFVLLGQQYLADPSRSAGGPDGVNPIYAYAHVPNGYTGDATEKVIAQIERFAPGFRDRIVAVSTRGTRELEAHNANYVGGDIGTGANTISQLVFRPRPAVNPYSLGAPGMYLCSAATPPAAGVHGMGGFRAAESALAALR
ncbi:NAD(P)/FAD-dependent oxidoreductase [Gordonia sp. HY002]|uniref:phytoene desaturase family protein n=1 Tax=Gordonia zhenghanii TaxID=2911516 RepID=UPI001EF023CE|nr:NAD(P)/FAD-dependent oxidoreductase [Gordonia zhenghanii]MCF8571057.1 NAD(P)/FAD-dependent oxidoreductase [Gordonia zhenghanii]MCF8606252.1 NAD(P)/FAD-dependent oxidoreductase [Gordonia zhenghanii]